MRRGRVLSGRGFGVFGYIATRNGPDSGRQTD